MQTQSINNKASFGNYQSMIAGSAKVKFTTKASNALFNERCRFANLINRNHDELVKTTLDFETKIQGILDKNGKFKKIRIESRIQPKNKKETIRMGIKKVLETIRTPKYIREINVSDINKISDYMLVDTVNKSTIGAVQNFRPIRGKNTIKGLQVISTCSIF